MSATESEALEEAGVGELRNDDSHPSAHLDSCEVGEQTSEQEDNQRHKPADDRVDHTEPHSPERENTRHQNEESNEDEHAADLGPQVSEASNRQVESVDQDEAVAVQGVPPPERPNNHQDNEGEEAEWEEIDSSAEDGSASSDDSGTHSESEASDEAEKKVATEPAEKEELPFGCSHYRRKCKIVAPCCGQIFWCRHCHNEANDGDITKAHEIDRYSVKEVICAACETRQRATNKCVKCDITFGKYHCQICKFWDDQGEDKKVYHCNECGLCRAGGRENYFHCPTCDSCYPLQLQNKHKCLENAMRRECPVCLEDMFTSLWQSQVLRCGHTIHSHCLRQLQRQRGFQAIRCPMCSKSIADYSEYWKQLSEEIARTPLEDQFKRRVRIVCNDCLERSTTDFHFIGLMCTKCNSFNTRDIAEE